jgi:UDP-GlcNAc3NAcA epimerase
MLKILTVVGARPQFVKAGVVSRALLEHSNVQERLLHTGQHFDAAMSSIFFDQLGMPKPDVQLNINGGSHGEMTGKMLIEIEAAIVDQSPDLVLVYGDTNSTLAGALAAAKLNIRVAHVEAGLRSYNRTMPEEINRIITDQLSDLLFCPTQLAVSNLEKEGYAPSTIDLVGDVMLDAVNFFKKQAQKPKSYAGGSFLLATLHRAENTNSLDKLRSIADALNFIHHNIGNVLMPLHPRTSKLLLENKIDLQVNVIEPVGYFESLWLLDNCQLLLTDSGGMQKEAYFFGKPCVTMREETEWSELIDLGVNQLAGSDFERIVGCVNDLLDSRVDSDGELYGGGTAASRIAARIASA